MSSPVPQAHPAEVMLAVVALHVVTATILLDTNITLGTVLDMGRDIVSRFRIVGTLCQPASDCFAI